MQIKSTGPGSLLRPISSSDQTIKTFTKAARPEASSDTRTAQALKTITSEFRKADLQDPAKVDHTLTRCSDELLRSALGGSGGNVSPAASADLTGFLKNDPVIRGQLLNYLERTAT